MGDPERHVPQTDQERRARLNQRLRQAFIEGAEEDSRRLRRGRTAEELERVLRHYPGDIGAGGARRLWGMTKGVTVNWRLWLRWRGR